jgi:hypothetical protein
MIVRLNNLLIFLVTQRYGADGLQSFEGVLGSARQLRGAQQAVAGRRRVLDDQGGGNERRAVDHGLGDQRRAEHRRLVARSWVQ